MTPFLRPRSEVIVNDRFRILRRIGGGAFGDIYLGNFVCNENEVGEF